MLNKTIIQGRLVREWGVINSTTSSKQYYLNSLAHNKYNGDTEFYDLICDCNKLKNLLDAGLLAKGRELIIEGTISKPNSTEYNLILFVNNIYLCSSKSNNQDNNKE